MGINNINNSNLISVFPNPSNGNIQIKFGSEYKYDHIMVINSLSEIVYSRELTNSVKSNSNKMNLNLTKGIYLIQLVSKEKVISKKVIID